LVEKRVEIIQHGKGRSLYVDLFRVDHSDEVLPRPLIFNKSQPDLIILLRHSLSRQAKEAFFLRLKACNNSAQGNALGTNKYL